MNIRQPNSRHCFVCGVENPLGLNLKFDQTAPGEVTVFTTVPSQYQGYPGIVHGGIVAAMLDEVSGRAFMGVDSTPRFMYTARLTVRYRQHVPVGKPLRLVGRVGKDRQRTATATGAVYIEDPSRPEDECLLAECEALLVEVNDELLSGVDPEALGWKVYDDELQSP